jgi:hypothetical protein
MKMTKLGYFSEFLIFPPLVLVATLLAFKSSSPPQLVVWAGVYVVGLAGWTLIEYLLQRRFSPRSNTRENSRSTSSFPA